MSRQRVKGPLTFFLLASDRLCATILTCLRTRNTPQWQFPNYFPRFCVVVVEVVGMSKKVILLIAAMCLFMVGCGEANAGTVAPHTSVTPTAVPTLPPPSTDPLVIMGPATFMSSPHLQIKAGTPIHFVDPKGAGGVHYLVIGTQGGWQHIAGAPAVLNKAEGMLFKPGSSVNIVFTKPGTYPITCIPHPAMQIVITIVP
jgi:plastocyanin